MEELNVYELDSINGGVHYGDLFAGIIGVGGAVASGCCGNPAGAIIGGYIGAVTIISAFED